MVSCTKDEGNTATQATQSPKFQASIEAPTTRTYADENGKLLWTAKDAITLFYGSSYPRQYKFLGETGVNYGDFEEVNPPTSFFTANVLDTNYAIYPYDEKTTISNEAEIIYTIPSTQKYAEDSFGLGANVMVAVTENIEDKFLAFKNLGGYFEFSLYGDVPVKSIELKGNNGEKLAGKATITASHQQVPTYVFDDDATETLTLDCGEGVTLGADAENATMFWFVVPAITFEQGITITITDIYGGTMEKSTEQAITIERSTVQPLSAFELITLGGMAPSNQIWYTSSNDETITPNFIEAFGNNLSIVSNVYKNGKGVITFDGDVTAIPGRALHMNEYITSITIPDSVVSVDSNCFEDCDNLAEIRSKLATPDGRCIVINDELIKFAPGGLTEYTIPDGIKLIKESSFAHCEQLEFVTIPNSVTDIEFQAFEECKGLKGFTGKFASTDGRALIIDNDLSVFASADIASYTIPDGVTKISATQFIACDLESITFPASVTEIGQFLFNGCKKLSEIGGALASDDGYCLILNNTIRAYAQGNGLTEYTIPEGITAIGYCVFKYCNLTNIYLPNSLTEIGSYSFRWCEGLTSITIPANVTYIGEQAFAYCPNPICVYCLPTTPPEMQLTNIFDRTEVEIYVPAEAVDTYKENESWSEFADRIFAIPTEEN